MADAVARGGETVGTSAPADNALGNRDRLEATPTTDLATDDDDDDDVEDPDSPRVRLQTVTNRGLVIKSGFLNKVGDRPLTRRTWRKRFFVLSETALAYFTKDTSTTGALLKGGVLLHHITEIRKAAGAEKTRPYILVLVTGTRVYYVQARSDSERTEWMHIITATATAARQLALADDGAESARAPPPTASELPCATPTPTTHPNCIMYVNQMLPNSTAFLDHLRTGCAALQLFLTDVGVPWESVGVDASHWARLAEDLPPQGLPTALPLYEFDDTRVAHAATVTRQVCRAYGHLYGETAADRLLADAVSDMVGEWRHAVPTDAMDLTRSSYAVSTLPMYLKLFEVRLATRDTEFLAGSVFPLYADFEVFYILHAHVQMDAAVLDAYPRLRDFVDLMSARPNIRPFLTRCGDGVDITVTFAQD